MPFKSQPTITRPANATAYTGGDVVGGVIPFPELPKGTGLLIASANLRIDVAAIPAGMTSFRLHLYTDSPASAIADNAAWDLSAGDRAAYLGYVDLGSPADAGATLFAQVDGVNKAILSTGGGVYGYLVTNGGFTPAGNSEVYSLSLVACEL